MGVKEHLQNLVLFFFKTVNMDTKFISIFRSFELSLINSHGHHIKDLCLGQTCQMKMVKQDPQRLKGLETLNLELLFLWGSHVTRGIALSLSSHMILALSLPGW